jgi:hypothetical protein
MAAKDGDALLIAFWQGYGDRKMVTSGWIWEN